MAQISRRKRKTTSTTRQDADEQRNFNVVDAGANRSRAVHRNVDLDRWRDVGLKAGHSALRTASTVSMTLAPGILKMTIRMASLSLPLWPGSCCRKVRRYGCPRRISDGSQVADAHRRAGLLVIADNDGRVVPGFEDLVVVVDLPAVLGICQSCPWGGWRWRWRARCAPLRGRRRCCQAAWG